jgi:hypothetical protein
MPAKAAIPLSLQHIQTESGTPAFVAVTGKTEYKSSSDLNSQPPALARVPARWKHLVETNARKINCLGMISQ